LPAWYIPKGTHEIDPTKATNLSKSLAPRAATKAQRTTIPVHPAYLHWKGIATTWWEKGGDMLIITVGVACMVYTKPDTQKLKEHMK
jgi:hypothetical protein